MLLGPELGRLCRYGEDSSGWLIFYEVNPMLVKRLLACALGAVLVLSAACSPDTNEPRPKDWSDGEQREPRAPETSSPSPTVSDDETPEKGDRDNYKDIDLEDGEGMPEGSCGPYEAPTANEEFSNVEECNPGHEYGVCPLEWKPPDVDKVIVGSSGDDVLEGGSRADLICGMGGNDIIVGGGGEDSIWGGPGNDYILGGKHSDFLHGGDGDDILKGNNNCLPAQDKKCGPDFMVGDWEKKSKSKDVGNDVLLGGSVSFGEDMDGGPGDDVLAPTPLRTGKNYVLAGSGNDVAVTLNFMPGRPDHVWLDELDSGVDMAIPLNSACEAEVEINFDEGDEGSVSCSLPWGKKISGLDTLLPVSASISGDGDISMDMTLYNKLGDLSVISYREMVKIQGSLGKDVCICDLYTKSPPDVRVPYDYPADD